MNVFLEEEIKDFINSAQEGHLENTKLFYDSLQLFLQYPYQPYKNDKPLIWSNQSASLFDFGIPDKTYKKKILVVPSFINKPYILDLMKDRSLLQYFAESDYQPILLDWGVPNNVTKEYDFSDYITKILMPTIEFLATSESQIILAGYCLGGLVSLAATQLVPNLISELILLATPWDFSHFKDKASYFKPNITAALALDENISSSYLRAFFYSLLPYDKISKKFIEFSSYITNSERAELFVAIERWASDDMLISKGVYRECCFDFVENNKAMLNKWIIKDQLIDPAKINIRTLITAPTKDVIVPQTSSTSLFNSIKNLTVILPESGHVGMIIGDKRKEQLWTPLLNWLSI